jgi:hypothetical protein
MVVRDMRAISNLPAGYRNAAMSGLAIANKNSPAIRLSIAIAIVSVLCTAPVASAAEAENDVFQQAVNYVFTGRVDPQNGPEIVDRKACIVLVPEPKFKRYARYYLRRFKMDSSRISKKYSGVQTLYELEVEGDDVILEYLKGDKTTADYGFKSAHISLPGKPDQTQKALRIIFGEYCKAEAPKSPF